MSENPKQTPPESVKKSGIPISESTITSSESGSEVPITKPELTTTISGGESGPLSREGGITPGLSPEWSISQKSRTIFESLNEGGKKFATRVYETIHKIPVVNRIVGKMEIAFNQGFIDHHESKAANLKSKFDTFDIQINSLEDLKKSSLEMVEQMRRDGVPGSEKILLQVKIYDRKIAEAQTKRDKIQTKLEARQNKIKGYTNKRDVIADELIGKYEQHLSPMERRLEDFNTQRAELELQKAIIEQKNEERREEINGLIERRRIFENHLKSSGFKERQIQKSESIKEFDRRILELENCIRDNIVGIKVKEIRLNDEIAKIDKRANPYRDKRDEFVRLKQGRPIDLGIETRTREENPEFLERVYGSAREKVAGNESESDEPVLEPPETVAPKEEKEKNPEKMKKTIKEFVGQWNNFIKNLNFYGIKEINLGEFIDKLKSLGANFDENKKLRADRFSAFLVPYYKIIKSPNPRLKEALSKFIQTLK